MKAGLSILASVVVLMASVRAAGAQDKKKDSEPDERRVGARFDSVMAKRAALGIQLSSTGSLRDTSASSRSTVSTSGSIRRTLVTATQADSPHAG